MYHSNLCTRFWNLIFQGKITFQKLNTKCVCNFFLFYTFLTYQEKDKHFNIFLMIKFITTKLHLERRKQPHTYNHTEYWERRGKKRIALQCYHDHSPIGSWNISVIRKIPKKSNLPRIKTPFKGNMNRNLSIAQVFKGNNIYFNNPKDHQRRNHRNNHKLVHYQDWVKSVSFSL